MPAKQTLPETLPDAESDQLKLLNLQNSILEAILHGESSFQELLDNLCLCAEALVPDSLASVSMVDKDGLQLQIVAAPSASAEVMKDFSGLKPSVGSGSCANAIFSSEPTFVRHIPTDPVWSNVQDLAYRYSLGACWSFPVFLKSDSACGTFALSSFEHREPTRFQREVLKSCAQLVNIIWKQKNQEEDLWRIAHHDALTGLPNRQLLDQQLSHALQNASRNGTQLALMFIDLDNFKDINDSYGHDFGDQVLLHAVKILKENLREGDLLYRHGGDEFLLVLENLKSKLDADKVARKVLHSFQLPVEFESQKVLIQFSVGISLFPHDGEDTQTLLKNADIAMYQAKSFGKNNICYFESELGQKVLQKITLEQQMREALEQDEFELYYQAEFKLDSDEIESLEALIRWNHPQRGLLPPGEFIPVAETSSLISEISRYVMRKVCQQGKQWLDQGYELPRLGVNFSTSQLTEFCTERLCTLLDKVEFPAEKLEIEITETLLMNRGNKGIEELKKMASVGVSLALDDFGTGYSSLSQIKRLPIHKLKIDRGFVHQLETDRSNQTLVKTIIAMAQSLGMKTVAEGVETAEQQSYLLEQGCDFIQGYYRHRPAPVSEITALLKRVSS